MLQRSVWFYKGKQTKSHRLAQFKKYCFVCQWHFVLWNTLFTLRASAFFVGRIIQKWLLELDFFSIQTKYQRNYLVEYFAYFWYHKSEELFTAIRFAPQEPAGISNNHPQKSWLKILFLREAGQSFASELCCISWAIMSTRGSKNYETI